MQLDHQGKRDAWPKDTWSDLATARRVQAEIGRRLRSTYEPVLETPVPREWLAILSKSPIALG